MGVRFQDSVAERLDAALHRLMRCLLAVEFQPQALGGVAHLRFEYAIEASQRMFDDRGAGRTIHTVYAQTFMYISLDYRRARRSG